jgi:DNA-directed RNA polymerase subunit N (RpoN/RPB10)
MQVNETDLFKQFTILLLDRNKEHFDVLKEKLSMQANLRLDNSGVIRAMTEFFYDNQELLPLITDYVMENKGFVLLDRFFKLIDQEKTPKEIEDELGVGVKHYKKLKEKHNGDLRSVKETSLFKKYGALLSDGNKKHFDELRIYFKKQTGTHMDNSVVVRGFTEYLYNFQELLPEIVPYCLKLKGFTLLEEFMRMINENRTPKEIEEKLGISVAHVKSMQK